NGRGQTQATRAQDIRPFAKPASLRRPLARSPDVRSSCEDPTRVGPVDNAADERDRWTPDDVGDHAAAEIKGSSQGVEIRAGLPPCVNRRRPDDASRRTLRDVARGVKHKSATARLASRTPSARARWDDIADVSRR